MNVARWVFRDISAEVNVNQPLQFEQNVEVRLNLTEIDGKQIVYEFEIADETGESAVTGKFVVACCRFPERQPPFAVLIPEHVESALRRVDGLAPSDLSASFFCHAVFQPLFRIPISPTKYQTMSEPKFDAVIVVSFGGPEGQDDVMPFLENVLRGKNVPRERMLEVAEHYKHFGGVSPINEQNRELIAALKDELAAHEIELPIYWGNRNWHPMLPDTLRQMKADGIKNALGFFTSIYSCYSGCRQYRENIADAQASLGADAPEIRKLRMSFNHPQYIEASVDRVRTAFAEIPVERRSQTRFVFTAHSIPMAMAEGCKYSTQLNETCRLIMEQFG